MDHSTQLMVAKSPMQGVRQITLMSGELDGRDGVLKARAEALLALHQPGNPVILPTVWDAWSANLAVDAGFAALTVGSHPMADSIGKPDNEGMAFDDVLTRVAQITAAVDVPLSVDIESGYAEAPTRLIEGLLSVGAVGLNIEDTVHAKGAGCGRPVSMPSWCRCALPGGRAPVGGHATPDV